MSESTPRITAPYLEQFSHQTVRILGKVRQLRGEQATIDAGGQISVFLNRVSSSEPCEDQKIPQSDFLESLKTKRQRTGRPPPTQPRGGNHRQSAE